MTQHNVTRSSRTDFARTDFAKTDFAKTDFARTDFAKADFAKTDFDGTANAGRKGIAYDWQSLLAADGVTAIESELCTLLLAELILESAE